LKKLLTIILFTFSFCPSFAILNTPVLLSPLNGSTNNSPSEPLDWTGVTGATSYEYKLSTDPGFTGVNSISAGTSQASTSNLLFGSTYYWQVRALKTTVPVDSSAWSVIWNFSTVDQLNLISPATGSTFIAPNAILDWSGITGTTNYDYEWDTVATFNSSQYFTASTGTSSQVSAFNLRFGTKYYWRVRARHATDTTQWTPVWNFTTADTAYLISPVTASTFIPPNEILDWAGIGGVTNYDYEWDTIPTFNSSQYYSASTGTTTQASAFNLLFGTTYYWRVRARHAVDTSQWSAVWYFTTTDQLNLISPVNGSAFIAPNEVLDWSGINGITNYDYEWDTVPTFNSSQYYSASTGTTSQVSAFNLRFGTTYYWRVRARHAVDTTQWSSIRNFTTVDQLNLTSPVNGSAFIAPNEALDWSGINGITNYDYEWDTVASFNSSQYYSASTGTTSQVSAFNLRFGTTYYWRVRARHALDTTQWSAVWNFTTVDQLNLTSPVNGSAFIAPNEALDWSGINGITNYDYEWDTVASFNSSQYYSASTGTTSQVSSFNLRFGTTYYWRVRARHAVDTTQWSAVWNFTTTEFITHSSPVNNSTGISLNPLIDWSGFAGINGYQYRYSTDINFSNFSLFTIGTTSQASLSNLSYGTQYYWQVRAYHAVDTSEWSLPWTFTTLYQLTSAPSLISPANGTTTIPVTGTTLQWSSVSSATLYEYQFDDDITFASPAINTTALLNDVTGNLTSGTTYHWRVRAGNGSGFSPWSAVWSFTTTPITDISSLIPGELISAYPNPSSGIFNIITKNNINTISIYNVHGALVYQSAVNDKDTNTVLDLSGQPRGIYLIKCDKGQSHYSQIIVLQ
jgi:Secretion system C-terminal sorting domain